jgi:hypothetical protein
MLVDIKTNNFKKFKIYLLVYGAISSGILLSMESELEGRRGQVSARLDLTGMSSFGSGAAAGSGEVVINFDTGERESSPVIRPPYTGPRSGGNSEGGDLNERILSAYYGGGVRKRSFATSIPGDASHDDSLAALAAQDPALNMGFELLRIFEEGQRAASDAQIAKDRRETLEKAEKAKQAKIDWRWSCCYRSCTAGLAVTALVISLVQNQKQKTE